MASTSSVGVKINFQRISDPGIDYDQQFNAASNTASPAMNEVKVLVSGNNTITKPTGAVGVTIIPPSDNEVVILLKKVTGDTGLSLGLTDPTFISLAASVTSFVINASDDLSLRLIWS